MTSDEFAKNFYLEKLNILKSCFEEQPQYPSAVNAKIKEIPPGQKLFDQLLCSVPLSSTAVSDCGL